MWVYMYVYMYIYTYIYTHTAAPIQLLISQLLTVIFRKRALQFVALLRKMTCILSSKSAPHVQGGEDP